MARHYPSGQFPADVAPATKDRPGLPLQQHADRLAAIGVKISDDDRAASLAYLAKRDLSDVAEMLGLVPTQP